MANEWQETGDAEPNIVIHTYGDANDGYIEVGISGYTPDTLRVFLLDNGRLIDEIFNFENDNTLGIDISESGGFHQFKIVSIDENSKVTCSNIKEVNFNCPLNYCVFPEQYELNKPLYFSADNKTGGNVVINVYADCGELVWSQICDGNNVKGSIPAAITSQYEIDYIIFNTSNGGAITKIPDPTEPPLPSGVKALIILPDKHLMQADRIQIMKIQKAFKNNNIKYKKLVGKSASSDLIKFYTLTGQIKYMYVSAHGGYRLGNVLRTSIKLSDGIVVSMKISDFANPNNAPAWCQSLGNYWESRTKSFLSMDFYNLEFAVFDTCHSGKLTINTSNQLVQGRPGFIGLLDGPHNDLSLALHLDDIFIDRIYHGWYKKVPIGSAKNESDYQKWIRVLWESMGEGLNLNSALFEALRQQKYFGPDSPAEDYRLKGTGYPALIRLNDN